MTNFFGKTHLRVITRSFLAIYVVSVPYFVASGAQPAYRPEASSFSLLRLKDRGSTSR